MMMMMMMVMAAFFLVYQNHFYLLLLYDVLLSTWGVCRVPLICLGFLYICGFIGSRIVLGPSWGARMVRFEDRRTGVLNGCREAWFFGVSRFRGPYGGIIGF